MPSTVGIVQSLLVLSLASSIWMHFQGQSLKGPLNGIVRCVSCDVELHAVGVNKLVKHLDKFALLLITSKGPEAS